MGRGRCIFRLGTLESTETERRTRSQKGRLCHQMTLSCITVFTLHSNRLRGAVSMFYILDLPFHRLPVTQKAVFAKFIPALPHLTRKPECSCKSRGVAGIEEREAGYALPRLVIENVARFVWGLNRVMWKIEIDDVVAARQLDLRAR